MLPSVFEAVLFLETPVPVQISLIAQLREEAYIVNINSVKHDQINIAIIFKDLQRDMWNLVCNTGKFKCPTDDYIYVQILNTGFANAREFDKNDQLLNRYFDEVEVNYMFWENLNMSYEQKAELHEFLSDLHNTPDYNYKDVLWSMILRPTTDLKSQIEHGAFYINNHFLTLQDFYERSPTYDFLRTQKTFNENLSPKEKAALILYSKNGDHLLNMYIRSGRKGITEEMEAYYDEHEAVFQKYSSNTDVYELMEDFYWELKKIFAKAPPVDKEFIVYRGAHTVEHFKGQIDNIYVNKGIVSTSINAQVAIGFSGGHYMTHIHIPVGARVIYNFLSIYFGEYEIILPDQTYFLVTKDFQPVRYVSVKQALAQGWDSGEIDILTNQCLLLKE